MQVPNRACILTTQLQHKTSLLPAGRNVLCYSLQEALFSGASLETQVTTRWQQMSLIAPSRNLYPSCTTTWYHSANHSSYA